MKIEGRPSSRRRSTQRVYRTGSGSLGRSLSEHMSTALGFTCLAAFEHTSPSVTVIFVQSFVYQDRVAVQEGESPQSAVLGYSSRKPA